MLISREIKNCSSSNKLLITIKPQKNFSLSPKRWRSFKHQINLGLINDQIKQQDLDLKGITLKKIKLSLSLEIL